MGDQTIRTKLELTGAQSFKQQMGQAAGAMKTLKAEAQMIEAQYKATGDQEQYFSQKCENLAKRFQEQKKQVEVAQKALADLRSKGYGENSKAVQEWSTSLAKAQTGMYGIQAEIQATGQELEAAGYKFTWLGDTAGQAADDVRAVGGKFDTGGAQASAGEVGDAVGKADDTAENAKDEIAKVGGKFDTKGVEGSASDVGSAISGADDTASDAIDGIAKVGGSFATTGVEGSADDVSSAISSADDTASDAIDEIAKVGGSFATTGVEGSADDVSSAISGADDTASDAIDEIAKVGGAFATTGVEGSADDVSSAISSADDTASDAIDEIAKVGGSFATTGVEGSADDVSSAISGADDTAADAIDEIAKVGGSFATTGVEGSADDVSGAISGADDTAADAIDEIAKVGGSFATTGVEGSADDVSSAISSADDTASDAIDEIAKVGGAFATTGVEGSADDVSSAISGADDTASDAIDEIAKVGGSFGTSGVKGSADDVSSAISGADDTASDAIDEIAKVGGSFATTGVEGSADDVSNAISGADDTAADAKEEIEKVGGKFSTTGVSGSATDVSNAIGKADDTAADAKEEIEKVGGSFGTSGAEGSAGDVGDAVSGAGDKAKNALFDLEKVGGSFDSSGAVGSAEDVSGALGDVESEAGTADEALDNVGGAITVDGIKGSIQNITGFLEGIISKAASAVKALADVGRDSAAWADETSTTASQNGIDTTTLQQIRYASQFIDTDADAIMKAWFNLNNKMAEGGEEFQAALDSLGVSNSGDAQQVFWDIIDQLGQVEDASEKMATATELFGRQARDFNPLIEAGSEAYIEKMGKAPVVIEENVKALAELDDAYQELEATTEKLKLDTMAELAPMFKAGAEALAEFAGKLDEFVQSEQGQAALKSLSDAMTGLIDSLTSEENIQGVFDTLTEAVNALKGALEWIRDNADKVAGWIEKIGLAFVGLKIGEGAMTIIQLAEALGALKGFSLGGAGAAGGASLGSSIGSAISGALGDIMLPVAVMEIAKGVSIAIDQGEVDRNFGEYKENRGGIEEQLAQHEADKEEQEQKINDLQQQIDQINGMTPGQTGSDVKALQQTLVGAGKDIGPQGVDSIFGEHTAAAAQEYVGDLGAALEQYRTLLGEAAEQDSLYQILKEANDLGGALMDDEIPFEDYMAKTKELLATHMDELKEALPEMDFWQVVKDRWGTDEVDAETIFGESGVAVVNGYMDSFATDLALALSEKLKTSDISSGMDEMINTGAEDAAATAEGAGAEPAEAFVDAMTAEMEAKGGELVAAAESLALEAANAYTNTFNAYTGRGSTGGYGGVNPGKPGGGGNINLSLNIDGREFAKATAGYTDAALGKKTQMR